MEECSIIEIKDFSFRLCRQMLILDKCNTAGFYVNIFHYVKPLKNIYQMISLKIFSSL